MIGLLIILICSQIPFLNTRAQASTGPWKILFDEAHDQYYTYSNGRFTTALSYLNKTADFQVHLNAGIFDNVTKISPYDLIIIGNPGPDGNFSLTELEVLKNYTLQGGNLIILGNYNDVGIPTPDLNITSNVASLNNLTTTLNLPASFTYYDLHDENHNPLGLRWVVEIGNQNFKATHPISWKIGKVLTFTSGLNVTGNQYIVATGYSASYLKNDINDTISKTPWLYAIQQSHSKIILCGSTVMFSNLNVTSVGSSPYTGIHWINAADNLRLWANLIQWLVITDIPDFITIFTIMVCIIIAIGVAIYVYNQFFRPPPTSEYEIEMQNIKENLALTLKDARSRAKNGDYYNAALLYKKASKLSNALGDSRAEKQYNRQYNEFLGKSKSSKDL